MSEVLAEPAIPRSREESVPGPVTLAPGWWARGLNLAERCALPGAPIPAPDAEQRAARRLARWKETHGLAESGQFDRRLAAAGLTEAELLALLAEDPASLAARAEPPAWVELAEVALVNLAEAPKPKAVPVAPADESHVWQAGFRVIVAPFVRVAMHRFAAAVTERRLERQADVHALGHGLAEQVSQSLAMLASRTLVLELNVLRVTGRLAGATPGDRFWEFVRHFARPAGLAALLEEYPVLARMLAHNATLAVEAHLELLDRLAADRDGIVAELFDGADPGRLVEAAFGSGDQHGRGRSVALLRFAEGARLVYKPRPLGVHVHFNEVAEWLNRKAGDLGLSTHAVLDRGGYGWVEFVDYRPCADRGEVERYYRRLGSLLALLYALDCTDVHYENLIASGDRPMLVDLETVFHHTVPAGVAAVAPDDPAADALHRSVINIGLLPRVIWGEEGAALDMSGIGGDAGARLPFKNPTWEAAGTDEMRLVRAHPTFPGGQNRPKLDEAEVDPGEFTTELLAGFHVAYDAIAAHRDELVGPTGLLWRFTGDEAREVLRATMTYGRLLIESTHPDVLRDALDRDRVFDCLWAMSTDDPVRDPLVPDEIADLWQGDVPIFKTRPGATGLTTGAGRQLSEVFEVPALARAADKIRAMGPWDRRAQEWIISGSLATRTVGVSAQRAAAAVTASPSGLTANGEPDPLRGLAAARRIGDQLADTAYTGTDRAAWLGLTVVDESRWTVQPLRFDLYNGYPGVALFLGQLARLTGEERYAELARGALAQVPELVEVVTEKLSALDGDSPDGATEWRITSGGFSGLASLAYALVQLDGILDHAAVSSWVASLVPAVEEAVAVDETLDVIGGSAGCLGAMLAVHEATGLDAAARVARVCADRLVETAEPQDNGVAWRTPMEATRPLAGFSHGAGGIGWALLRYAAASGDDSYAAVGRAAFEYERASYRTDLGNWPDFRVLTTNQFRKASDGESAMVAWCHGAPGVGLARADILRHTPDPVLAEDLDHAVDALLGVGPAGNHSLCHGELGNLELLTAAVAAGRPDLRGERDRRVAAVLERLDRGGPVCGTPCGVPTPGLMTGLAGIGHGLLRLAFPERVPAVLLLEPPRTTA